MPEDREHRVCRPELMLHHFLGELVELEEGETRVPECEFSVVWRERRAFLRSRRTNAVRRESEGSVVGVIGV